MRCLLIFSVLIVAALCQSCAKPVTKCVNQAAPCATTVGGSGAGSCDFSSTAPCTYCKKSICDPKSFVCQGLAKKGDACTDIGAAGPLCLPGFDHAFPAAGFCLSSKCAAIGPVLYAGDTCSKSDALINTADTTGGCVFPATCGDDGKCTGSPVNGNCSALEGCSQGQYCNASSGVCVDWAATGAACNNGEECEPGSVCTGDIGKKTCVGVFSIASGGTCDPLATAVLQKDAGTANLLCTSGTACITDLTSFKSTCSSPDDKQQGKSCSDTKPCTAPFTCFTNPCTNKASCFAFYSKSDASVADAYKAYLGCLKSSKCDGDSTPWSSGSGGGSNCAFNSCNSQWTSYINTISYPTGDCPSSGSSASTLVVATTLVVAAAAIALL